MSFFTTRFYTNKIIIICLDLSKALQTSLWLALSSNQNRLDLFDPYSLHAFIVDEIVTLFDTSVWGFRDLIRNIEMNRIAKTQSEPDFPLLHDTARHFIHSSETLNVAVETLSNMIHQHEAFAKEVSSENKKENAAFKRTHQHLQFQLQVLRSLAARSQANELRLKNEITLSFNMIAQRDSQTAVRIGHAARSDSAAMKIVAILTLTFLPATFVSALFSMSFFNYTPGSPTEQERWTVSDKMWIYWAFTVPLTGVTVASWFVWQRWYGPA